MKSLRQDRELDGLASLLEVSRVALEIRGIGEDGETGGAALFVGLGDGGRVEVRADEASGRRGFLDLGDEAVAAAAVSHGLLEGQAEASRVRRMAADLGAQILAAVLCPASGDLGLRFGADAGQDVGRIGQWSGQGGVHSGLRLHRR